jgi:hypothetical protein
MKVKIKLLRDLPKNCCLCGDCSGISESGDRYCLHPERNKTLLNKLKKPENTVSPFCPLVDIAVDKWMKQLTNKMEKEVTARLDRKLMVAPDGR